MPKKNDELEPTQPKTEPDVAPKKTTKKEAQPAAEPVAAKATTTESAASPAEAMVTTEAPKANGFALKKPQDLKKTVTIGASVVIVLLVLVTLVFGVLVYGYKSQNVVVRAVASVIPYPVERVNGAFVSYHDYLFEVDANEKAYQSNAKLNNQPAVDFKSADGKKLVTQIKQHALDKLKSDVVIAQLASQKKVTVTDKDVTDLTNQLYQRYGGKDTLLKTLNQIYGWNLADLNKVIRKQLLAQKLQEKVTSDPALDAQAKAKATDVLNKLKAGGDFAALAKQYSQASDASTGGDLGNVTAGQLPDDEQKAINALQAGQMSDVVKTQYGYEIFKVLDKSGDSTHAQHILIEPIDFNNWLTDQVNKAKVNTYIKA